VLLVASLTYVKSAIAITDLLPLLFDDVGWTTTPTRLNDSQGFTLESFVCLLVCLSVSVYECACVCACG